MLFLGVFEKKPCTMAGIKTKSKFGDQSIDHLSTHPRSRKLHKRKSNIAGQSKAMEGIIMKITETTISETEKNNPQATTDLSASDTEVAFIHPTSSARRHRRKKIRSMETELSDLSLGSNKLSKQRHRKEASRNERESSISLSENSDGDTGGEGDDEMTDYCSGPESTIPEVINWWDKEDDNATDEFQTILRGAIPFMSSPTRSVVLKQQERIKSTCFRYRPGRWSGHSSRSHRRGRRKNKSNLQQQQQHQQSNNNNSTVATSSSRNLNHNDVITSRESRNYYKRRKATNDEDLVMSQESFIPIPSTNIGYQMLADMGWTPGQGLNQRGITEPVMPKGRRKRCAGLGF